MDRSEWGEERSRTLTWHDPMIAAAAGRVLATATTSCLVMPTP